MEQLLLADPLQLIRWPNALHTGLMLQEGQGIQYTATLKGRNEWSTNYVHFENLGPHLSGLLFERSCQ